ncbi:MAG: thioredoxin family protein, partial [Oscillospiraceae bacterium]|nr:thioredoxin family protein [Oscillospiraceae bacterium]
QQLNTVFSRMANPLVLRLSLDDRAVSAELKGYMEALCELTDKLSLETVNDSEDAPVVKIYRADGSYSGLAFHGVPGGHEFTSFVLGLYNAAGPGQAVDEGDLARIRAIDGELKVQVLVSLSCTMCPELVTAAQRIAAENGNVSAEVYDINHFPHLRERYNVMSVPCLVVNDGETVSFGKKNISQLLDVLGK